MTFSSVLYFGTKSSCSRSMIPISQIFLKSNHVVIIFVPIMISASLSLSRAFSFSHLFFTLSVSNLKTLLFGNILLILISICCVPTHTFLRPSLLHFSHFIGMFFSCPHR